MTRGLRRARRVCIGRCWVTREDKELPLVLSGETAPNYELRDPDVLLMLQVRQDNIAAFEELVLRYQGRLITVLEQLVARRRSLINHRSLRQPQMKADQSK